MIAPSKDFVELFCRRVYSGNFTQAVQEQFTEITKRAFQEFVSERVNMRLQSALATESQSETADDSDEEAEVDSRGSIVTTEEEIEAFYLVKSIARGSIDPKRVFMRDTQSYCGILLDDNNRKPICRFFFREKRKYLGLLDEQKKTTRHPIEDINDIYNFSQQLCEAVNRCAQQHKDP